MDKISAHLLIVDDDPVTLDLLKEVLSKEGYEIATALSGEEAISKGTESIFNVTSAFDYGLWLNLWTYIKDL